MSTTTTTTTPPPFFDVQPLPYPATNPPGFQFYEDEPVYDPSVHLNIRPPSGITLLGSFESVPAAPPVGPEQPNSQMAFTSPFTLLSEEGLRVLRNIVERDRVNALSTDRAPCFLRHLGYKSKWIRDFNNCPVVLKFLSSCAGEPLVPHSMPSNYAHTNIGKIGEERPVDQWHADSVPFVIVILISDMTGATGGDLQLIKSTPEVAFKLLAETKNNPPADKMLTVPYEHGAGSCVFMQGCEIIHHVTPVMNASQERITVVNSYMPLNPFGRDTTKYDTFKMESTAMYEFARHKAWRAKGQLEAFLAREPLWREKEEVQRYLESATKELQDCLDLLKGEKSDKIGYFDEKGMEVVEYKESHRN